MTDRLLILGLLLAVGGTGCRTPQSRLREDVRTRTSVGEFLLRFSSQDAASVEQVSVALLHAGPPLAEWGQLDEPVTVHILPTHAALEAAVHHRDYPWLRAWGKYDEIFIQSPATWNVLGASQSTVDELVLHELTHSLMYQVASDRLGWTRKGIPLWFREGMASFIAQQGYRWPTLEALARARKKHPDLALLDEAKSNYRVRSNLVYGAAHHAFEFLILRYGKPGVERVLAAMARGAEFPAAFDIALGLTPEAFLTDFDHYVRWRGFKRGSRS